jgi:hypothetical protein
MRREIRRKMENEKRMLMTQFEKIKQGKSSLDNLSSEFKPEPVMGATESMPNRNTQSQKSLPKKAKTAQPNNRSQKIEKSISNTIRPNTLEASQQSIELSNANVSSANEKEGRKAIENLKLKQNHEMLLVLEEEQAKENQREAKLNSITDPQEKKRLEKIYAMERAKAHARIQQLTE